MTAVAPTRRAGLPETGHWELARALGAAVLTPPPANEPICEALGLPAPRNVDHTDTFVLNLPPHAAIYLGAEGKLGGEGLDRLAGFWRVLGMSEPEHADHLGALLMLYAELGEAEHHPVSTRVRGRLRLARSALFDEHLWSWAPAYLAAVSRDGCAAVGAWAELTMSLLRYERHASGPCERLPMALRLAPDAVSSFRSLDDTLDTLVAPVRSGFVLTQSDLRRCASVAQVGYRRGERRFAAQAMLQQSPTTTLAWFADHARSWSRSHATRVEGTEDMCSTWWAARAAASAEALAALGPSA